MSAIPFGMSAQPSDLIGKPGFIVCDNRPRAKLAYALEYAKSAIIWTDDVNKARVFETKVAAENWFYMQWNGYTIGDYQIRAISYGLSPCAIKYAGLYLKNRIAPIKYLREETHWDWTTDWSSCLWFRGAGEALKVLLELNGVGVVET